MSDASLRILIVEDEGMIAKQVEAVAKLAGHLPVGIAATAEQACDLVVSAEPDLALVDVNLADRTSGIDVANFIAGRASTHVLFATANRRNLPSDFCGTIGVIEKPFTRTGLTAVLNYVASRIRGVSGSPLRPDNLHLSSTYASQWRSLV